MPKIAQLMNWDDANDIAQQIQGLYQPQQQQPPQQQQG